jgi:hypothetical protein
MERVSSTKRYASDKDHAQGTAKMQLKFILDNVRHLRKLRGGDSLEKAARSMAANIQLGGELSPNQLSYVDSIYEKAWKAAGFESVETKHDFGPRKADR